jgi:hypothetical protein
MIYRDCSTTVVEYVFTKSAVPVVSMNQEEFRADGGVVSSEEGELPWTRALAMLEDMDYYLVGFPIELINQVNGRVLSFTLHYFYDEEISTVSLKILEWGKVRVPVCSQEWEVTNENLGCILRALFNGDDKPE